MFRMKHKMNLKLIFNTIKIILCLVWAYLIYEESGKWIAVFCLYVMVYMEAQFYYMETIRSYMKEMQKYIESDQFAKRILRK